MEQAGPTLVCGVENQEGYAGLWRSLWNSEGSMPRVPVLAKEVSTTSGCENQRRLWPSEKEGAWSPRQSS